jgi:hypothetical protein
MVHEMSEACKVRLRLKRILQATLMIFLSRHHPRMGNFLLAHCPDSTSRNHHNRDCLARQRDELDLVSGSIRMDHHNPTYVSSFHLFFRLALCQYDGIKFLDHC